MICSSGAVEQYLASDYFRAPIDPMAQHSRPILDNVNSKFSEELKLLCLEYGEVEVSEVFVMSLDRFVCSGAGISEIRRTNE